MPRKLVPYLIVGPFAILLAFPFYWMLITALKTDADLYNVENNPFKFGNGSPTTANFKFLFTDTEYAQWLVNTAVVGVVVVVITLVLALPAGYALARLSGSWGQTMGIGIFLTYLVPPTLLFLPLARVISEIGKTILSRVPMRDAPSISAASSSSRGIVLKKPISSHVENGTVNDG